MSHDRIAQALALWQRFPNNDLSRFNLAQAYVDANDFATAVEHLRALCRKKPRIGESAWWSGARTGDSQRGEPNVLGLSTHAS